MKHIPLIKFFAAVCSAVILSSCKKDLSVEGDGDPIDARLVAAWYNRADTVKRGTIILPILKTEGEDIHFHMVYRIPNFVTTFSAIGQYRISANRDTLHLTIPVPDTDESIPFMYNRTRVGARVVPWP